MKLFIDTSDNQKIILKLNSEEFVDESENRKSQRLLLFIEEVLEGKNLELKDITEIEVYTGPGSFTGLRVGVSVAQALAWALNIPVNGKKAGEEEIAIKYS